MRLINRFRLYLARRAQLKAWAKYRRVGGMGQLLWAARADGRVARAWNRIQPIAGCDCNFGD